MLDLLKGGGGHNKLTPFKRGDHGKFYAVSGGGGGGGSKSFAPTSFPFCSPPTRN